MALLTASFFLAGAYAAIMLLYLRGWRALPEWRMPKDFEPRTFVSVVIAARNEAANIETCLRSVVQGTYPPDLLEIIVADDFSEDDTAEKVRQMQKARHKPVIRLIRLSELSPAASGKKKALAAGIAQARGALIVTTDADCVAPEDWLRQVVSRFQPTPAGRGNVGPPHPAGVGLLAAPVAFHRETTLFRRFQSLDFLGLMGITGAGIHCGFQRMGNGANLAFPKSVFEEVGGYDGSEHLASGDDMFLIAKINRRYPGSVFFLKNAAATVLTEAKPDLRSFVGQRLRWGTKNAALPEWPVRLVLLTVFLFCWSILINSVLAVAACISPGDMSPLATLSGQLTVKAVFDYLFLREMCRFFDRKDLLRWFVPSFFLHTLYLPLAGAAGLFGKTYEWKGRRVR